MTSNDPMAANAPSLGVPMYVHPLEDPQTWDRVAASASLLRYVIVNVHNGPGEVLDESYLRVINRLRGQGIRVIGYIDTDYATRPAGVLAAEAELWRSRYAVDGLFFDQVAAQIEHLNYYSAAAVAARACGAQFVVLNPGSDCHPEYIQIANVTVTFEGTYRAYQSYRTPSWMLGCPEARFSHIVHDVPTDQLERAMVLASSRHADTVYLTDGSGANPYAHFSAPMLSPQSATITRGLPAMWSPPWGQRRYIVSSQLPVTAFNPTAQPPPSRNHPERRGGPRHGATLT